MTVTKNRTITFTVGDKSVLIHVISTKKTAAGLTSTKYSTWMQDSDWMRLVSKQEYIDALFSSSNEKVGPKSAKRKREEDDEEVVQVPVKARESSFLPFYSYKVFVNESGIYRLRETLKDKSFFVVKEECEAAGLRASRTLTLRLSITR